MRVAEEIVITDLDAIRLRTLARQLIGSRGENRRRGEALFELIETASVVPAPAIRGDRVTMNSTVRCQNGDGNIVTMTLVYPDQADAGAGRISVLSPVGFALLGLQAEDEVEFETADGVTRRLRLLSVVDQPEANGDWSR